MGPNSSTVPEARTPNGSQVRMTDQSGAPHDPRTRELEVFAESSWLVASTLDLGEVLERLADVAQTRLGVDIVRIWLLDARTGLLTLRAENGTSGLQPDGPPGEAPR